MIPSEQLDIETTLRSRPALRIMIGLVLPAPETQVHAYQVYYAGLADGVVDFRTQQSSYKGKQERVRDPSRFHKRTHLQVLAVVIAGHGVIFAPHVHFAAVLPCLALCWQSARPAATSRKHLGA